MPCSSWLDAASRASGAGRLLFSVSGNGLCPAGQTPHLLATKGLIASMRRRLLIVLLASLAVTVAVPLWAGLTFEGAVRRNLAGAAVAAVPAEGERHPLAEAGTLAVTGGLLIGLASAVRRTA
jgi:hypothetical protein